MKLLHEIFYEARLGKNITIAQLHDKTKIAKSQLDALEKGMWESFQSYGYVRGVVSRYAKAVGVDQNKALSLLRRDMQKKDGGFIRTTKYRDYTMWPLSLVGVGSFIALAAFFIFQFSSIMKKPQMQLKNTPATIQASEPLNIEGTTEQGVLLYLNGERLYQSTNGHFKQELYLKKGTQTLELKAVGTNGQELVKKLIVQVK